MCSYTSEPTSNITFIHLLQTIILFHTDNVRVLPDNENRHQWLKVKVNSTSFQHQQRLMFYTFMHFATAWPSIIRGMATDSNGDNPSHDSDVVHASMLTRHGPDTDLLCCINIRFASFYLNLGVSLKY